MIQILNIGESTLEIDTDADDIVAYGPEYLDIDRYAVRDAVTIPLTEELAYDLMRVFESVVEEFAQRRNA